MSYEDCFSAIVSFTLQALCNDEQLLIVDAFRVEKPLLGDRRIGFIIYPLLLFIIIIYPLL